MPTIEGVGGFPRRRTRAGFWRNIAMSDAAAFGYHGLEIAIIGMAGRFPGAKNVAEFWRNLRDGVESISFFTDDELNAAGVDSALLSNPDYVKANGALEGIDLF